jgi:hypothetical protein
MTHASRLVIVNRFPTLLIIINSLRESKGERVIFLERGKINHTVFDTESLFSGQAENFFENLPRIL